MESRRDFVKYKILGGFLGLTGLPLLSFKNSLNSDYTISENGIIGGNYDEIDWDAVRKQFLFKNNKYFFNSATIGPSPQIVIDDVCNCLRDLAFKARDGRWLFEDVRKSMAEFLNTSPEEIAFTRNTTEGMNIMAKCLPLVEGDEILLTSDEHIGGSAPWLALQETKGVKVKVIEIDQSGENNLQRIKDGISSKTKVISISHYTCTTGLRLPVEEVVELCKENNIYSCIDGAQAMGMVPIDLKAMNPDFYAASGHKWLFGPEGTGVLYINKSVIDKCNPVFVGAYSDLRFNLNSKLMDDKKTAQREEYGTRSAPLIVGLGSAIKFISGIGIDNVVKRGKVLSTHFRDGAKQISDIEILTPESTEKSASIITIRIKDRNNQEVTELLRLRKKMKVRHVYENEMDAMRISFAIFNSLKDVDYLLNSLEEIIKE